jgi:O-6-methylguanine DNA methyltransferase
MLKRNGNTIFNNFNNLGNTGLFSYNLTGGQLVSIRFSGQPNAARAVGQANGSNPLPIVIPCHRVIASDGSIGGYSGGLAIKHRLLALESIELDL